MTAKVASRPIKYRVWSAKAHRWLTPEDHIVLRPDGMTVRYAHADDLVDGYEGIAEIEVTGLTVCRWTGLHDKHGVEILEGDVVWICRRYGYGFLPKGATAEVSWSATELCYFLRGSFRLTAAKQVEVIGNIYESPELPESAS